MPFYGESMSHSPAFSEILRKTANQATAKLVIFRKFLTKLLNWGQKIIKDSMREKLIFGGISD